MFTQHSQPIIDLQQDDMMTGGLIILRQILHLNASSIRIFKATGTLELLVRLNKDVSLLLTLFSDSTSVLLSSSSLRRLPK
jgi:hypothetical protein